MESLPREPKQRLISEIKADTLGSWDSRTDAEAPPAETARLLQRLSHAERRAQASCRWAQVISCSALTAALSIAGFFALLSRNLVGVADPRSNALPPVYAASLHGVASPPRPSS